MQKRLNIVRIQEAMEALGLNQAGLSSRLHVSRSIVSSWFKRDKFPRPDKLLKLGTTLGLPFQEIVEKPMTISEPIVAFRKKGMRKTKDVHIKQAQEMGQLLELLVPYIQNERLFHPAVLKNPKLDYGYIQMAAARIRQEFGQKPGDPVDFGQLINKIIEFDVVLLPVFHGNKSNHENALHIYLPASNTTWIYLNLDSNIHDFKFWMAHELGHVIAPSLRGNEGEDFADSFAQALLFPAEQAKGVYDALKRLKSTKSRIHKIIELSKALVISPVTIYTAVNSHAYETDQPEIDLAPDIYAAASTLNKTYSNVAEEIMGEKLGTVENYFKITKDIFKSPFFDILRMYLSENEKSAGFIQSLLDTSILDAKEIHAALVK